MQRTDGVLLAEGTNGSSAEEPVVGSATSLPLAGIIGVQMGLSHGCAVLASGSASCWLTEPGNGATGAQNTSGQLGNGTTTSATTLYSATPVLTAPSTPLANVTAVADGSSNYGCAITSAGQLWCWGDLTWIANNGTMLTTGYAEAITTDGTTPLTGVVHATLGPRQACALLQGTPNTVWCWGNNAEGELGQSDTMTRRYPTKVLGFTNPTRLVAAAFNETNATMCVLDGANVRCWGDNNINAGPAGINSTTDPVQSPTLVVPQTGAAPLGLVTDLQPGFGAFSTLRSDQTLWNWGTHFADYAANYGLPNVLAIGFAGGQGANGPRYVTSDGVYHNGMTNVTVKCGML